MSRRTAVVDGPLAFQMRRFSAAQSAEQGLQIQSLPLLAARLVGGFIRPALADDLEPAVADALSFGGFREIDSIRALPGMTRAAVRTLKSLWAADLSLEQLGPRHPRLADLALLEDRVRQALPSSVVLPQDLRTSALRRIHHAPAVLGSVELEPCLGVATVWQPLLGALAQSIPLVWRNPATADYAWFAGQVVTAPTAAVPAEIEVVSCADPRGEVIETLRWARELIASGKARPQDIAICAPSPETWDESLVALAESSALSVHFSSGVPALSTREGQMCAALATVLTRGLGQERIRRLISYTRATSPALEPLPDSWSQGLAREATLLHLEDWRRALDCAVSRSPDQTDPRPTLLPVLELLARGFSASESAGDLLLDSKSKVLWRRALRAAPPEALEFSLRSLRVSDGREAATSMVWAPSDHLVGAARPFTRLLGLSTGAWPRQTGEDPLLPSHILDRSLVDPDPVTQRDRRAFNHILVHASHAVLSFSRRDAQGRLLPVSPLIRLDQRARVLTRGRRPEHAFSESDRLFARPTDASSSPRLKSALACWRAWHRSEVTPHDGHVRVTHPLIGRALARVQSATSLRLLLRDPLAFVWRYALGWHSAVAREDPLTLTPRAFGDLVHDLLRCAVDRLEPDPGYGYASQAQIDAALLAAAADVRASWPLERALPPPLLWEHILEEGHRLAGKALHFDPNVREGTRCWTEVHFGQPDPRIVGGPWDPNRAVPIPNTTVRVRGSIDRLDLRFDGRKARVSDYKTGVEPDDAENLILGGGNEIQRVIYALAIRELLPEIPQIQARLLFLRSDPPREYALKNVEQTIATLAQHVGAACELLNGGKALPSMLKRPLSDEFRIALPASLEWYEHIKRDAVLESFGSFTQIWDSP